MTSITYQTADVINTRMAAVYKHMALAVLTSMIVGWLISTSPAIMALLFGTPLKWVVMLSPLVAIFFVSSKLENATTGTAILMLHGFASLMGVSLATIFAVYTSTSIVTAFMGAAVLFTVMSVYGYFTKRSLSSIGQYLFVALIAIIIVSIINTFIGSSMLQIAISAIAILVFLGLTAYDTQNIRDMIMSDIGGNIEISGALSLYLNFINIFVNLLSLFGVTED